MAPHGPAPPTLAATLDAMTPPRRDTTRQHRLTGIEEADLARALMGRLAQLSEPGGPPAGAPGEGPGEAARLRQLLERFTR